MMDQQILKNLQDRTDSKLRYAAVHLEELRNFGFPGGSDFDRAHEESFLYHLLGAEDAFLQELNVYYGCQLNGKNVNHRNLAKALEQKGKESPELEGLHRLHGMEWFIKAKHLRDHGTHEAGIPRVFDATAGTVSLRDPRNSLKDSGQHFPDEFADWLNKMRETVESLRHSALEANKLP